MDRLIEDGKIDKERIFLTEPKTLVPQKKEKVSAGRVEFQLK
jgi:hypothetical protein